MPPVYSPTARLSAAALALRNGDPANVPIDRAEMDARAFALAAHPGTLRWSRKMQVAAGGSLTSFGVDVGAISCLVIADGTGELRAVASSEAPLGVGNVEGTPGTLGAFSAEWHVYAGRSGTSLTFQISGTAPDPSLTFKSAVSSPFVDVTKRYLGTFFTDSTGAPIPMLALNGRCLYRRSAVASVGGLIAADGLRAVDTIVGVARTALDLSDRVPLHARRAILLVESSVTSSSTAAVATVDLYDAADTTSVAQSVAASVAHNGDTARNQSRAEVQLTNAQVCGYAVTVSGGVCAATIDLLGWEE